MVNDIPQLNKETIHKEVIDKELPRIIFQKQRVKSCTDKSETYISVSDTSSEKALKTFNELRKSIR